MLRSFIITLVAIIIFAIPTMATVIHVPSDYLTIQAGINASINGDTVLVAPGTYSESIRFGGKKIVLKSESGASTTIIQPPQHRTIIISLTNGEDTTTIIQGFTIRGAVDTYAINVANAGVTLVENIVRDNTSPYSGLTHGSALRASNSTINIRSNSFIADTVTHLPGSGTLTFESTVASITGNIFRDNYNNLWASSISSFESSMIVDSNYFYNNFGYGAGAIGMTYNQKTIIKNNIFDSNSAVTGPGAICCGNNEDSIYIHHNISIHNSGSFSTWEFYNCSGFSVENNTSYQDTNVVGFMMLSNSQNFSIINNIISLRGLCKIRQGGSSNFEFKYNDIWSDSIELEGFPPGPGSISLDPLFIDPANGNLHLQASSPCIDGGDPASPLDPDSSRADMGALYFDHRLLIFTISANADPNGTISPSGDVLVNYGADQTFTITSDIGYHILNVLADSISIGPVSEYTFENVRSDHEIFASFLIDTFVVQATSGPNGSINPSGTLNVIYGDSLTFIIRQDTGYHIQDVLVDSISVGPLSSYTFNNVVANHSIAASFAIDTFVIQADAGAHGNILPFGNIVIDYNRDQSFIITPDTGYYISSVIVDGDSVGQVSTYTFHGVMANHTISASFAIYTFTITASSGQNGTINPTGVVQIDYGSDTTFAILPNTGYNVLDVLVDGNLVGPVTSYTFSHVTSNHSISASFAIDVFTIMATAGENGSIYPAGLIPINYGEDTTFIITPDVSYHVEDVEVDGNSVGAVTLYTFNQVDAYHLISASFALDIFGCDYVAGDANGNGVYNGIDVVYMVNYLKGSGPTPPDTCNCPPHGLLYAAADANGNCAFNGIDVTYTVNYLKDRGPGPRFCSDCPPVVLNPPGPAVMPIMAPLITPKDGIRNEQH